MYDGNRKLARHVKVRFILVRLKPAILYTVMFVCLSVPRKQIFGLNSTTEWLFFGGLNGSFSDLRCEPEWKRSHNLVLPNIASGRIPKNCYLPSQGQGLNTMKLPCCHKQSLLMKTQKTFSNLTFWLKKHFATYFPTLRFTDCTSMPFLRLFSVQSR